MGRDGDEWIFLTKALSTFDGVDILAFSAVLV